MFAKLLNFLYKLTYYFSSPSDMELVEEDHHNYDLTGHRLIHMQEIAKYFVWRKYSLYLIIPFLLTNIIVNITNYFTIKENIEYYQHNTESKDLDMNIRNSTEHFIQLLNSGKTLDYILFYNILSSVCISIELLFICLAIYKSNIWYISKKWVKYCAWFSYFWIYFIYVNPLMKFFKLETQYNHNNTITNQNYLYSYSFTYILYKLLKEILPLSLCFFTSLLWSISNIKCLFPCNIYIGWLYGYATIIFYFTSGTLLLVINQLMNNTIFSISTGVFFIGLYLSNCIYGKRIKYFYKDNKIIEKYNFKTNFIKNIGFSIYFLLLLVFILLYDNPLTHGIYKFYKSDISYFITKLIYKIIFYKILCCDILIGWILKVEKYRDIYKFEMNEYCEKMKFIERQLYEDTVYNTL